MEKEYFYWNSMKIRKAQPWEVYQEVCDEVFGEDVCDINCDSANKVLMHLMFVDGFGDFKEMFKARLMRLKERMEDTAAMDMLVKLVERVADEDRGEAAYAKLAALDMLWDWFKTGAVGLANFVSSVIEDMPNDGNPYEQAEEDQNMVLKLFAYNYEDNDELQLVVLVRPSWNTCLFKDDAQKDYQFYRALARRTFVVYEHDYDTKMDEIACLYDGEETVGEMAEKMTGIVVIDEGQTLGQVVCNSFVNPNCYELDVMCLKALKGVVEKGDEPGIYEDFESDNY
jgi:hypothetical protein